MSSASVYAVAAIAAVEGKHVLSGDIGSAFLNANILGSEDSCATRQSKQRATVPVTFKVSHIFEQAS